MPQSNIQSHTQKIQIQTIAKLKLTENDFGNIQLEFLKGIKTLGKQLFKKAMWQDHLYTKENNEVVT